MCPTPVSPLTYTLTTPILPFVQLDTTTPGGVIDWGKLSTIADISTYTVTVKATFPAPSTQFITLNIPLEIKEKCLQATISNITNALPDP